MNLPMAGKATPRPVVGGRQRGFSESESMPRRRTNDLHLTAEQLVLFRQCVPMAHQLAHRKAMTMLGRIDEDDFHSSAMLGLADAAQTFDPNYGARFTTYAHKCIRSRLGHVITTYWRNKAQFYAGARRLGCRDLGRRYPDPGDVANVAHALDGLSDRECLIVRERAAGMTLEDIGNAHGGLTKERVRQILNEIEAKLRRILIPTDKELDRQIEARLSRARERRMVAA